MIPRDAAEAEIRNDDETAPRDDGTIRKAHYGAGRQPWDDIVDAGWSVEFAAANVLKYLRRTKDPEHSLAAARWYYARLREQPMVGKARAVREQLLSMLTAVEFTRLIE